eukprot:3937588-Rhodomonas_salina.1
MNKSTPTSGDTVDFFSALAGALGVEGEDLESRTDPRMQLVSELLLAHCVAPQNVPGLVLSEEQFRALARVFGTAAIHSSPGGIEKLWFLPARDGFKNVLVTLFRSTGYVFLRTGDEVEDALRLLNDSLVSVDL